MADGRPPEDRDVRDDLVAHYQSYARSRGADPSTYDLETLAISDLTVTDRVEAELKQAAPRTPAELEPSTEPTPAEQIATSRGYRFAKTALPAVDPVRPMPPLFEKPMKLAIRMRRMCERIPGVPRSTSIADQNFIYPVLAKDVIQEHTDFQFRRRKYRGLNAIDRQRAFWRAIEDIADRSTGVLGPWWVK